MKSLHFNVQFGKCIEIIRVNENEQERKGMSPAVVEIIKGGGVKWNKVVRYKARNVRKYQQQFNRSFCLPPSSAVSNPLFSNEFDSFARILKCFDDSKCSNLFQELFDSYTHFKWKLYLAGEGEQQLQSPSESKESNTSTTTNISLRSFFSSPSHSPLPPHILESADQSVVDHLVRAFQFYQRVIGEAMDFQVALSSLPSSSPPPPILSLSSSTSSAIKSLWRANPRLFPLQVDVVVVGVVIITTTIPMLMFPASMSSCVCITFPSCQWICLGMRMAIS